MGGSTVCFLSLMLVLLPAPDKFNPLGIRQRTLAVVDATSYFKDKPNEYYESLRQSARRAQEDISEQLIGVPAPEPELIDEGPRLVDGEDTSDKEGRVGGNPEVIIITPTAPPVNDPTKVVEIETPSEPPVRPPSEPPVKPPSEPPIKPPSEPPVKLPSDMPITPASESPTKTPTEPPTDASVTSLTNQPTAMPSLTLTLEKRAGIDPSVEPSSSPSVSSSPSYAQPIPVTTLPNVFSFYANRQDNLPELDDAMMKKWKGAWENAGYNARVLTVDDAAQHPEYGQYRDAINAVLATSNVWKPQELVPCYLRYLAMAVVGGGMMVDLDMTPKTIASESNVVQSDADRFTVHCNFDTPDPKLDWVKQVETQNGLPCAAMASADEWYRIGKLMGWVASENLAETVWTDAHALQFMTATGDVKMVKDEVAQSWRTSGWDRCHFRQV